MSASAHTTELRGLEAFAGTVLRSAAEATEATGTLDGMRVALVGDPASVVRLVERLAGTCATLKVFQSEGMWVLPHLPRGPLAGIRDMAVQAAPTKLRRDVTVALADRHRRRGIRDGWTERQLTPRNPPTTRTVVSSNRYYRTLRRADVELITWPIAGVVPEGVRTADGLEHHVDVLAVV